MATIRVLEGQRAELTTALADARRQLRHAKAAARASTKAWRLTLDERRGVLMVYVKSGYAAEPAVLHLSKVGRRRRWPDMAAADAVRFVEDLFLQADAEELGDLGAMAPSTASPALRAASQVVEEWGIVAWSRRLNTEKGVAPSTDAILQRLAGQRHAVGHPSPQARGTVAQSSARMWASRFRRRWGGRFGCLPVSEVLPLEEMRAKAGDRRRLCIYGCRVTRGSVWYRKILACGKWCGRGQYLVIWRWGLFGVWFWVQGGVRPPTGRSASATPQGLRGRLVA